ncbi:hypothetical protein AB0B42_00575 [Streptomyces fradiae]|uniref:hypothetical protein n=1 Tax=Streptomyces fradiae TaxID=1906 RepID=UPI0033D3F317
MAQRIQALPTTGTPTPPARRLIAAGYVRRTPQALDDARPSHAFRFLTEIAHTLSDRRIADQPLTATRWQTATSAAHARTITGLYPHTANNAIATAITTAHSVYDPDVTCGEYALRLRAAARSL